MAVPLCVLVILLLCSPSLAARVSVDSGSLLGPSAAAAESGKRKPNFVFILVSALHCLARQHVLSFFSPMPSGRV